MSASSTTRWTLLTIAFAGSILAPAQAPAQQSGATPAPPKEKDEEPFWAVGRPKSGPGQQMAPVPALPIPAPADKLPIAKIKLPPGFKAEVWATDVLDARSLRQGDKGTVFVSSLFVARKIYAVVDRGGKREVKTLAEKLMLPSGIEYHKGALYVATPKAITLYVPVGAPCNICEPSADHAQIRRMNLDGTGAEVVARGVRNTVGFDFHPKTGELWFTDNQRDWLSEDLPNDELNRLTKPGQHFGYPYCHQGDFADPELRWGKSCDDYAKPAALLGPHSAPLGMRFYTGTMFPPKYRNAIFIARHGPWNRTKNYAGDVVAVFLNDSGTVRAVEPFLTGLVENNGYLGRPVDVMVMRDGSLLVSDDHNGAIYRISPRADERRSPRVRRRHRQAPAARPAEGSARRRPRRPRRGAGATRALRLLPQSRLLRSRADAGGSRTSGRTTCSRRCASTSAARASATAPR